VVMTMVDFVVGLGITLSILIFVHEIGHFLAAKRSGVRVETFSMGFGPKIFGFTRGETEYRVSAIPFGGYVKMAGEDPEAETTGGDWEFLSKNKRVRAFIVIAGPAMNFLLAVVLLVGLVGFLGVETVSTRVVGTVVEDAPAWKAGLREWDEIQSVGGKAVGTWDEVLDALQANLGGMADVGFLREGKKESAEIDLTSVEDLSGVGIYEFRDATIGQVAWRGPAYAAGLRPGDRVVSIDGVPIRRWQDLRDQILPSPGKQMEIVWERNGRDLSSVIVPKEDSGYGLIEAAQRIERSRVGMIESVRIGVGTAVWAARQITRIKEFIAKLFRGEASSDMIGGPIRIGEIAGDTLRWGLANFLVFIAVISAQLSIINLLPIPVLDGGHLLLLGLETITRRPITAKQRIIAHQIGFAFLLAFMVLITLFDISRFFQG
jgi:regulator of sigma E protease